MFSFKSVASFVKATFFVLFTTSAGTRLISPDFYLIRYEDSVEDRVHQLLSGRLNDINKMFGQIPDVLKDVWIDIAENKIEEAKKLIDEMPEKHPFDIKYAKHIEPSLHWEKCTIVLNDEEKKMALKASW